MSFIDRIDAGRRLAPALTHLRGPDTIVLGLPRGGVPVAREVADALGAPLDVIVVRKLGVPFQPELAMGAIGEDGVRVVNESVVRTAGITDREWAEVEQRERAELERRVERLRAIRPRAALDGKVAIIVDDGLATGATARAACEVARAAGAARVILAVPVGAPDSVESLRHVADEVVCLERPSNFFGVGQWYEDFSPVTDDAVVDALAEIGRAAVSPATALDDCPIDELVRIPAGGVELNGDLLVPEPASGVVVFAHGSGSSRHSARNRQVAAALNRARIGTLLLDLLTEHEELDRANVFDVELLARRLVEVTNWVGTHRGTEALPLGYFGASTGAAAALWAAADLGDQVAAVVSRGGRPDLAAVRLPEVRTPTLLIVGGADPVVADLNLEAQARLRCPNRLEVIPGATHLFPEPGALERVAELACDWFARHFETSTFGLCA